MNLIEPCCTQKHWPEIRRKLGTGGTVPFHGFGDLSIEELFPVLLTRYSNTDMLLVCPGLPNAAADILKYWMDRPNVLRRLTVITNLHPKKSPTAAKWKKENPWPGRLTMYNVQQNDTAILLPDIAIYGNINLAHSGHFTALATNSPGFMNNLRKTYEGLIK